MNQTQRQSTTTNTKQQPITRTPAISTSMEKQTTTINNQQNNNRQQKNGMNCPNPSAQMRKVELAAAEQASPFVGASYWRDNDKQ